MPPQSTRRSGKPKAQSSHLGHLRERLAAREMAEARAVHARGGARALAEHARAALAEAESSRARLGEARDTALDVLTEVVAKETLGHELRCEAAIAVLRSVATDHDGTEIPVSEMVPLATTPGRWSRRTEAIAWLRDCANANAGLSANERADLATIARALTSRSEHRWVQPAALALLASVDASSAAAVLRERLDRPGEGDDLLVRERMVDVAGRMRHGGFEELVTQASFDPSEHVRMTAARVERRAQFLASSARSDRSHRVRAVALASLVRRLRGTAVPTVLGVLARDANPLVLETSVRLLIGLAERGRLPSRSGTIDAVAAACARPDLSPRARNRLVDLLAELEVKADSRMLRAHDALAKLIESAPLEGGLSLRGPAVRFFSDRVMARVLSVLARRDFGIAADRTADELILYRSEPRNIALWRVLFELFRPAPAKRQGFVHTWARKPRGALRAPPGGLAELTATRVPGERVLIEELGDWGRHLPLVDDFLQATSLRARPVTITTAYGTTRITPAKSLLRRIAGTIAISRRYEALCASRRRSLETPEAAVRSAYVRELSQISGATVTFESHLYGPSKRPVPTPPALAPPLPVQAPARPALEPATTTTAALAMVPLLGSLPLDHPVVRDFWAYATSLHGNRLPEVAAYGALVLLGSLVRSAIIRRGIDRKRRAIPLVIGGWGTRGKSGTERLKAGLFQGLGYDCLVKTTGCEAMFIHAVPGVPAREIFLHRPYDKATVWEQRDVLSLASRLGVRVFLWECMALQPDLVNLLQAQWMRDDYSTVTNAYPDHEDVQGPTGYDVADCIAEFVPTSGHLFTTEDQMLPILRQRARERGTELHEVGEDESELISEDILRRFPYQEHPRNIALVAALAGAMGIPRAIALVEMADNVVPDLGVLKTYPEVEHEGRRLSFTNGMSANERTGALGNWQRAGFHRHDPERDPARWIVTVVNNRADRVARSEVFARLLVEDLTARRHVLIGTNVKGLLRFIDDALERHLRRISPTSELSGAPSERLTTARARLSRALAALGIGATDAASVERECVALGWQAPSRELLDAALTPSTPGEPYADAKRLVAGVLGAPEDAERRAFLVESIARRRAARALEWRLDGSYETTPALVESDFRATYRALFLETIVPLEDPSLTGDAINDRIARAVPPGARASIMGLQNIKGTGLDFVYRWVSIDAVEKMIARLRSEDRAEREQGLRELSMHGDFGVVDARRALAVLEERSRTDAASGLAYGPVVERLRAIVGERARRLEVRAEPSAGEMLRRVAGKTLDHLDAIRRPGMASAVVDELVGGRISHATAAARMRAIVSRQKGAWMTAPFAHAQPPEPASERPSRSS